FAGHFAPAQKADRPETETASTGVFTCITLHPYVIQITTCEVYMSTMSLRLPDEMADTLAHLAKATGRSKSFLALDALREYLTREAWQIAEIQRAIEEADAGEFASTEDVKAVMDKWSGNAG
ncbi:Ribbon-helix-helix protein, copG family domain protein, partial [Pseudomonas savastanoi pv. glycinea]